MSFLYIIVNMIDHEFYCGTENVMNVSPVVVHSMKLGGPKISVVSIVTFIEWIG